MHDVVDAQIVELTSGKIIASIFFIIAACSDPSVGAAVASAARSGTKGPAAKISPASSVNDNFQSGRVFMQGVGRRNPAGQAGGWQTLNCG